MRYVLAWFILVFTDVVLCDIKSDPSRGIFKTYYTK